MIDIVVCVPAQRCTIATVQMSARNSPRLGPNHVAENTAGGGKLGSVAGEFSQWVEEWGEGAALENSGHIIVAAALIGRGRLP
jgi:hypothetical protein